MSVLFSAPLHFLIVRSVSAVVLDKVEYSKYIFIALKYY